MVHHSVDCDWCFKWIDILLQNIEHNNYKGKVLMGPMLDRMLNPSKGYCTEIDKAKRDHFTKKLFSDYPRTMSSLDLFFED